ncbi:hypothetical protein [Streptomyces sp. NPDC006355]|uniref:hypothetical protein n=1 Tax=Streptomyces sp. NPDC006355 TaxID=3156758 RepID=UPI0033B62729
MDAGLAAVLGALAGAVATTGAAFATGWSAREQAKIAARAEHRRQRRDARQTVYEDFINAVEALIEATRLIHLDINEGNVIVAPSGEEVQPLENSVGKIATKVILAGPASMSERVQELRGTARSLLINLLRIELRIKGMSNVSEEKGVMLVEADCVALGRLIAEFSQDAQAVLDDDGTQPTAS